VLEEDDIASTNHVLVIEALSKALVGLTDRPEEIYLMSTATNSWSLWPLLIGSDDQPFWDKRRRQNVFWEVDATTLTPVMVGS